MEFKIGTCVKTRHLNKDSYDWLLTKLISQGYHWPSNFDKSPWFDLWSYVGVTDNGDIMPYDNPDFYLPIGEQGNGNNILSKEWLTKYLGEFE